MRELTLELQQMMTETDDLDRKLSESRRGLKEQVATILSMPPPRVLYRGRGKVAMTTPPGRSTLQAPKKGGRGHERRASSGDRRLRVFNSTL